MINLVEKYLERNNYSQEKLEFEDLFQSHPNFPSLFAITDSLALLSIPNKVDTIPKENFNELPDSFLAVFKQSLVLVSKTLSSIVFLNVKGEKKHLTFDEFIEGWSGLVIVIEPNEIILNQKSNVHVKLLQCIVPVLLIIAISFFYNKYTFYDYFLLSTSILGLFFSTLITQEKLGYQNELISKFCNESSNTSCTSPIKSKNRTIRKWLNYSDLPMLFFSINLLSIVLEPTNSCVLIGALSLFAIPLIVYRLWIRRVILEKWCVLCLVVASIILIQGLAWFFVTEAFNLETILFPFAYIISLIFISSFWIVIKPILENIIEGKKSIKELKKFKLNYMIFDFLLQDVTTLKGFEVLQGLTFGNKDASVQLNLILSPNSSLCHAAFKDGFDLVKKYPKKIFLNVLFNVNPFNNDNPYTVVVESLLAINDVNPDRIHEAITDWHLKQIGLKEWKIKWGVETITTKFKDEIQKQYDWCLQNKFNYSPVKIVNNKLLPSGYEINELKYFFNDFEMEREFYQLANLTQEVRA